MMYTSIYLISEAACLPVHSLLCVHMCTRERERETQRGKRDYSQTRAPASHLHVYVCMHTYTHILLTEVSTLQAAHDFTRNKIAHRACADLHKSAKQYHDAADTYTCMRIHIHAYV